MLKPADLSEAQTHAALVLFEAVTDPLSHSDIRRALNDQLDDMYPGKYAYVQDVYGDDSSGDVVYCCDGQLHSAPYTLGTTNGERTAEIDTDSAKNVVPHTTYEEEADDEDSYASQESFRECKRLVEAKLYTKVPSYERFISKSERDSANASDFAGKGKSFPVLKPGDVMAAVRSMGRAGSDNVGTSTLKKNIIAIAKRKGWTKYLPKAWQGSSDSSSSESLKFRFADDRSVDNPLKLTETAATLEPIVLQEARADYEIRLISPGAGSSAYYPREVLQRDGPKVFKAGTHVYLNHPTEAEEAARPEGDVANLAGVLTTDATYSESHPKGEGLYARMKVFADHAQMVEEKAPHVGMSIRAAGKAESGVKKNGLPVLTALTHAESVDIVTRAGRDGKIFTEAVRPANSNTGDHDMTEAEVKRLIESNNAPLRARLLTADATAEAFKILEGLNMGPVAKQTIVDRVTENAAAIPVDENGDLKKKKFRELVEAEAQRVAVLLSEATGGGRVIGMGQADDEPTKKQLKEAKRAKKEAKESRKEAVSIFESLGMPSDAAKIAARGQEEAYY